MQIEKEDPIEMQGENGRKCKRRFKMEWRDTGKAEEKTGAERAFEFLLSCVYSSRMSEKQNSKSLHVRTNQTQFHGIKVPILLTVLGNCYECL